MTPLVEQLLARRDPRGVLACSCGMTHRIAAADVLVERGALARAAELFGRRYRTPWVLSDENTEAAAGGWKRMLGGAAIRSRVLPGAPRPVPSLELAEELAAEVRRAPADVLVAIGSGVVSDLVKKVSHDVGLPSWCIATAPSVDAYSSATASLHVAGHHESSPARMSEVIVCDLDVIAAAPRPLLLAGLGDLLAKFVAALDWQVAHLVTGEHRCPVVANVALESARAAARAAQALASGSADGPQVAAWLSDAVLASGFAMQAMGGSRPAASAEHTIAHFWEVTHAAHCEGIDLHGILVGAATALILPGYLAFYGHLPTTGEITARVDDDDEPLEPAMQVFAGMVAARTGGRSRDPAARAARRKAYGRQRERIAGLAAPLLAELAAAVHALKRLGFPLALDALGIPEPLRMLPVRNVRLLRDRHTTFDLAHDLGCEERLIDAISGGLL
jgi:glycerol-1-phosphate dehydrogenase [NAD(P)+]